MTTLWRDMRYAGRMIAKTPGLSVIIILTLALGIGATTVVFSIANTLMFQPLPVPHASRIMAVGFQQKGNPLGLGSLSYVELGGFASQSGGVFAALLRNMSGLSGWIFKGHPSEQLLSNYVTRNFLRSMGVKHRRGRLFGSDLGEQRV